MIRTKLPMNCNHHAEKDRDLSVDTSDTEPFVEIESEWVSVIVVCNRNRKKTTWLNDSDTS